MDQQTIITFSLLVFSLSITFMCFKLQRKAKSLKSQISSLEIKFAEPLAAERIVETMSTQQKQLEETIAELRSSYNTKRSIFDELVKEAAIYDETIRLAEQGFYKPHFEHDTSERYKLNIEAVRSSQKTMLSEKSAVKCSRTWTVDGNEKKGRQMIERTIRLTTRAFNNECDSAIASVSWSNIDRMQSRIEKAFEAINKLNESYEIYISKNYLNLKLKELWLAHEFAEKKRDEKEEQAAIRQQMREEARLNQEVESAFKEEEKYQRLLDKAQKEASVASGEKLSKLEDRIAFLQEELTSAHEKSERAKSMAQLTKAGHVYVISNVGSFGENVYKIGMTRRLDPLDRVRELGDASVPFTFDIHAMIYSDDAPKLEHELHRKFDHRRVNLVNARKEFFIADLSSIEKAVKEDCPDAEFIITAEAREHRETLALRLENSKKRPVQSITELPVSI